jgi:hypothetical protein
MRWLCVAVALLLGSGVGTGTSAHAAETSATFTLGTASARRGETARRRGLAAQGRLTKENASEDAK